MTKNAMAQCALMSNTMAQCTKHPITVAQGLQTLQHDAQCPPNTMAQRKMLPNAMA